ncbi:MAG: trigger factor [Candidatus Brocadiia bacterium]
MADEENTETGVTEQQDENDVEESGIHTEIERHGSCECSIRIEIDADYLEDRFNEDLDNLQQQAQLPGFRQGKAPRGLVLKRYNERLRNDVVSTVAGEAYQDAVQQNELSVVEEKEAPDFESLEWDVGQPLEVEFQCEILPEVEIKEEDYKGLELEIPELEVTDEMFEQELERFAGQLAGWDEVEEGSVDQDDYVESNVTISTDKVTWSEEIPFQPGEERIGPFEAEGIKGAIIGASPGDSIELEVTLADDADLSAQNKPLEALADTPVKTEIEIQSVYRQETPEIDDDLAQQLGMEDVEELRSMVRDRLDRRLEQQRNQIRRNIITDTILENIDVEMPDSLIQSATEDETRRMMTEALRAGRSRQEAEQMAHENAEVSRARAVRNLKVEFILRKIAENERVYVLDSEVQEQVRAVARRQNWTERKARGYLEENNLMRSMRWNLREEKTVEALLDEAEINYVPPEEFGADQDESEDTGNEQESEETPEE